MGTGDSPTHPFASWFEAAPAALVAHDGKTILACSQAAAKMLGGTVEDFVGRDTLPLLTPESKERFQQRIEAGGNRVLELTARRLDGTKIELQITSVEVAPGTWVAALQPKGDASRADVMRSEILEKEEVRRLQEMNEFKTQLLNTTAHELNTPLTPLRLQLHLLTSGALGKLDERQGRALDILDRNVQRLSFLVNDILDVARLEGGRMEVDRKPLRIADVVLDAVDSYTETASRVGVQLDHEIDDGLMVDGDAQRLVQVLYNLVGNALKFTPKGGRVLVRAAMDKEEAMVCVEDTGPGLTAEQISRLFQPFSRVHDTKHSTIAGTGLGLYISKGIIDAHGGRIEATSPGPGKGAMFCVHLPRSETTADEVEEPRMAPRPKPVDALAQRLRELI